RSHRLGAGRVPLAGAPARPAAWRRPLYPVRPGHAVPLLALCRCFPGRAAAPVTGASSSRGGRANPTTATHQTAAAAPSAGRAARRQTRREVPRVVYTVGFQEPTPRIDMQ